MKQTLICLSLCSICPLVGDNYGLNKHWNLCGEFVLMRRSEIHNISLIKKTKEPLTSPHHSRPFTVISTRRLVEQFDYEPGYRVRLMYNRDNRMSFEGNFLWLDEWEAKKTVKGDRNLSFPFKNPDYTDDFNGASVAIGDYKSHFWDAELNFWRHFVPHRTDYFGLSLVFGLRYIQIHESFGLTMIKPPDKSSYDIHTANRVFGPQVGLDFQMNPMHWFSWEAFAKIGGMINSATAKTRLRDQDGKITLRDFDEYKHQIGVFVDLAGQLTIHCAAWLNFYAGYEMIYLSGLALAPEQVNKHTGSSAGKNVYTHGDGIVHGLYTGLICSF